MYLNTFIFCAINRVTILAKKLETSRMFRVFVQTFRILRHFGNIDMEIHGFSLELSHLSFNFVTHC